MPHYMQGDVFSASIHQDSPNLSIIFGHVGLNCMATYWRTFANQIPNIAHIRDPFSELPCKPYQYSNGRWLWFFSRNNGSGLPDQQLASAIEQALSWASSNGIRSVIINGIIDTNRGNSIISSIESDANRVLFMKNLASKQERINNLEITLISLDEAFIKPTPFN